jgi:hypothetical protein
LWCWAVAVAPPPPNECPTNAAGSSTPRWSSKSSTQFASFSNVYSPGSASLRPKPGNAGAITRAPPDAISGSAWA